MTVDVWTELAADLGTDVENDLRGIVRRFEDDRPRSKQRALGPSTIGMKCSRCLARKVLGQGVKRQFDDPWCRIVGTAVHAWLDEAALRENVHTNEARWLSELQVQPDPELLPSGGRCDLYDTHRRMVIDHKVVGKPALTKYRSNGPGQQYRAQAHLYGLGYSLGGRIVEHVAIAFWPRGGRLSELHVWTEKYDQAIALAALDRYRAIRDFALAGGPGVFALLPADPDCWDCEGKDV